MTRMFLEEILIANLKQELDPFEMAYMSKNTAYERLKIYTGQDFGDDLEAWEKWVSEHGLPLSRRVDRTYGLQTIKEKQWGKHRIVKTPNFLGGKPHVEGHRIGVHDVVIAYLELGESLEEVAENYGLNRSEIYSALTYYYDHRDEIDAIIQKLDQLTETLGPGEDALAAKRQRD